MKTSKYKKAFTLIELLVVISIISLLSSIILASVTSARDRAQVGAGRQFEAEVLHTAGDMIVGQWKFDECAGATAADSSGNGNTGTLINAPVWSTNTPTGTGCSLSFNGTSQYVTVPDSASMDFTGDLSIGAWINPSVEGGNYSTIASKRGGIGTNYHIYLYISNGALGYYNNTQYFNTYIPPINKWTYVTAIIKSSTLTLYANGVPVYTNNAISPVVNYGPNTFTVGAMYAPGEFFGGLIDSVSVYNKSLTAVEVKNLYLAEKSETQGVAMK